MKIWLNGKLVPKEGARVSVFDHGLLYGDGVFEGIRSYNGRIFKLTEHLERLYRSAKSIILKIPLSSGELEEAIIKTLRANNLKDAYIRVVATRGVGDLGLDPAKCSSATVFIIASKIQLYPEELYEKGLSLITAFTRRNDIKTLNPAVKSLNYLNNILAKIEATNAGALEAIMLNKDGYVAECTGDNIFMVKEEALQTPPASAGILEGITRNSVIELAQSFKIPVKENLLTRDDLYGGDEVFLTGTAAEIIPVTRIDGRIIKEGKVGPLTQKLRAGFKKLVTCEGREYAL
ncbi:MAG: branched-chain amino acid aminotransferase [bacterium (Candidatus Ratteibacteria) CG_4_10_14_3_um_filter_41_18]|uniref:Branched-chain-amino-acid aminotransferase n=4 Tax=Candidatus Ratteibacteria TaxID=2979319 RepID=A0A2M7EAV0_9BACT|nr:MAG: branched-chain amino acid aminotransferase [bacterium (Candidatus Ratteibacteria) CG01_land_8_20_14_3_00_40_19]PIW32306.1 MAG: branched-chain amino acid aminotransferase [bacterium (Candidatus Ratteibacteria) CG15_BIG_FIL_POST_REV_8_21_14_020_41_12]PIW74055.1 MAG: branched-chain amino acid aminotransferase [bacterium (Candidatus Ratteibacteria) CG_4_8_14_3_um_filter_41_36]PIX77365.1 MAG: branched-chain amino acid aminotransferase [bacterium (Candidatus Ratteibacteria) CG_4_10_14_3_um_fil